MASRSSGRPWGSQYVVWPARRAATTASVMWAGRGKSGWPRLQRITRPPAASTSRSSGPSLKASSVPMRLTRSAKRPGDATGAESLISGIS